MRIVIPGGTGLIGRALAADLAADGHDVVILSRDPARAGAPPPGARIAAWDARSAAGWAELADGAQAIVNLAGAGLGDARWTPARKAQIRESRSDAGRAVAEAVAAAAVKPGVVIQASAVGYYGPRGDEPATESDPAGSDFAAQVCRDWEASSAAVEAAGVRRALIRTGVVLATDGGALPKMALPFKLFVGGPVGSGRQWLSWIHLADEVAAIRFLIEHPEAAGPFNLSAPNPLTNRDFSRALGQALHRPALFPVPAFVLKLLFGEMSSVLLTGQRVIPARLEQLGFTFRYPSADAALAALYRP
jgi:uncharacterized protein (TIGR01777 family)